MSMTSVPIKENSFTILNPLLQLCFIAKVVAVSLKDTEPIL